MLKSYESIYENGRLNCLGVKPVITPEHLASGLDETQRNRGYRL